MKKLLYTILIFFVSVIAMIVIAANSSFVIKKAADTFAPDFNISYEDITGNILTGVKIKELKFKEEQIAKVIGFSWNPAKLLYKRIAVNHVSVEKLNVDAVMALIDSFPASEEDNGSSSSAPFPLTVTVGKVDISVDPFVQQGIAVDKILLRAKNILYASDSLAVGGLKVDIDTNVTKLRLEASLNEGVVSIHNLDVNRVDTLALQALFVPTENNSSINKEQNATIVSKQEATDEKKSGLIPHLIRVDRFHADILPAVYEPVHIHTLNLDAKGVRFDVEKLIAKEGMVDLNGTTNLSNITEHGSLRDNHFDGHIVLTPNQPLFDLYAPMIRKEAIGAISLDVNASKEKVTVDIFAKAKHLLANSKESNATDVHAVEPVLVDIDHLKSHLSYRIENGILDATMDMAVDTPFTHGLDLQANATVSDGKVVYRGILRNDQVLLPDGNKIDPVSDMKIVFQGDQSSLETSIGTAALKGYFNVPDFRKEGKFHIETRQAITLNRFVTLPAELNMTKVNAQIDVPIDLSKPLPIKGKALITSNIADIHADLRYDKTAAIEMQIAVPQNSLLRSLDRNIQWSAISPMKVTATMNKETIHVSANAKQLSADVRMSPSAENLKGTIRLAGMLTTLDQTSEGDIVVRSDVGSFEKLMGTLNRFYHIEPIPKIEGKLDLSLILKKNGDADVKLSSPQITYYSDRKTAQKVNDLQVVVSKKGDTFLLTSYQLVYDDMRLYATKPSLVALKKEQLTIDQIWLNDQLKVTGELDLKRMEGEIVADAQKFHIAHEMADLDAKVHVITRFNGEKTDIQGKITILDAKVHYDLGTKSFPSDSDIVIVQDIKPKNTSPFMDHLTINLDIDTQKPIVYKQGPVDVKANAHINVFKAELSQPLVIGSIDIIDGSSYTFEGKRFVLEKSHIFLTGDPQKPLLDIKVKYQALRHLITISISGTPAVPTVLLSSVPSLKKEQILSIILFGSEEAAGSNSGDDMMKMMGGAMAKSALNDMGVKIDHLAIGEGNSVEVGKKLTDNITVIYISGEIPRMEMKYRYSPSIEVVVGASERSESLDTVYIKDFNLNSQKDDDIVIKSKK